MGAVCCSFCFGNNEDVVPQNPPSTAPENPSRNYQPVQTTNPQTQLFGSEDVKESSSQVQGAVKPSQPVMGTSIPVVKGAETKSIAMLSDKSLEKENECSDAQYVFDVEEDVCPTCLEEYTVENPRIVAKCSHEYHLSCIYEWMKRSNKCPICDKLMQFDE